MRQFTPAQHRVVESSAAPALDRRGRESDADRRAIEAIDNGRSNGAASKALRALPDRHGQHNPLPDSGGQELGARLRAPFERGFNQDFSGIRVFTTGPTADAARSAGSRAITCGPRIAFAPGQWAPETPNGRALLAHELAHVTQQAADGVARVDHNTLDEELDEELKSKVQDQKSLDPAHREYARSLQGYGYDITHDMSGTGPVLLPEPKDPKAKEAWKRRFQKIDKLANRILDNSGPDVEQKEARAEMLAVDLATAGFLNEAMALAPKITDLDLRKFVHQAVLDQPAKITEAQITTIAQDQASNAKSAADHALLARLTSDQGVYAKALGSAKVNAALKVIVKAYASDPDLPEKLAGLMFFHPGGRVAFTDWMLADKRGALLKQVSQQAYFVEGANISVGTVTQHPDSATLGWAIGNKQRVTVEDVMALCAAAGTPLKAPTARDIATLRTWLELNTEKIGQAVQKQNPGKPEAAKAMYTQIVDAFTWHVPPDTKEDVKPDKSGHVTKLSAAGPQKSQLKVDCDVLATYGVRLLVASGYTPIGYMAITPTDPDRTPHALALLQEGKDFHAISNTATRKLAATDKAGALEELRDFGLAEAYDPARPLAGYRIYYMDSDAKGTLPDEVLNQDSKAHNAGLSK